MEWSENDVTFEIYGDMSEDDVVALIVSTPVGIITIIAEFEFVSDRLLIMRRAHVSGLEGNSLGYGRLRQIMNVALQIGKYDEIVIEGGNRTTGANPGHQPRPLRFRRAW